MIIKIKPLSINEAFKGRRFRTDKYKRYEKELFLLLPKMEVPKENISLFLKFGFSNKLSDIDNPVKSFIDVLQKFYKFNDRDIYKLSVEKEDVKKGDEYIYFKIKAK